MAFCPQRVQIWYTFSNLTYILIVNIELFSSLVPTTLKLLHRCSKMTKGKHQSYAKGPPIFTTGFLLSHFGGPAFLFPQIMCVQYYQTQLALSFWFLQSLECKIMSWITDLLNSCCCFFLKQPLQNGNKKSKIHTCPSMTACFGNAKLVESQTLGTRG